MFSGTNRHGRFIGCMHCASSKTSHGYIPDARPEVHLNDTYKSTLLFEWTLNL